MFGKRKSTKAGGRAASPSHLKLFLTKAETQASKRRVAANDRAFNKRMKSIYKGMKKDLL